MKNTWDKLAGGLPFEYTFMDDDLDSQYKSDESLSFIVQVFTTVAIIISALGLFALSAFAAENRLKEMGVRKVLGASGKDIFFIMSGNFSLLILISFVLSIPLGWYFIRTWLNSFAFRIDISPWIFLVAGLITFAFAILVISYQCLKVSLVNPVNVLKDE
jgi:putative ABC transport system permease protein